MAVQAAMRRARVRTSVIGSALILGIVGSGCAATPVATPVASVVITPPTPAATGFTSPTATAATGPAAAPAAAASPAATPAVAATGDGWTALPGDAFTGATLEDVETYSNGFVAVGSGPTVDGRQFGGVWTSVDGRTWSAASPGGFGDSLVRAATAAGDGILAVGMTCQGECGGFYSWRSTATGTWPKEVTASAEFDTVPVSVVARGSLIVAAGFATLDEVGGSTGVVFTSQDGKAWRADRVTAAMKDARPISIAAGKGFVIVGSVNTADGRVAAAWSSPDGISWTRAAEDPSFMGAAISSVVKGGPGYVAVGSAGADGAVWTSTDGKRWARLADQGAFTGSPLVDVATDGTALIAIGNDATGGTAWTSTDGASWVPVPPVPGSAGIKFDSVAIGPTSSVIIGEPPPSAPTAGLVFVGPRP